MDDCKVIDISDRQPKPLFPRAKDVLFFKKATEVKPQDLDNAIDNDLILIVHFDVPYAGQKPEVVLDKLNLWSHLALLIYFREDLTFEEFCEQMIKEFDRIYHNTPEPWHPPAGFERGKAQLTLLNKKD